MEDIKLATKEEIKSVQLTVLKAVDKYCTENNIRYFAAYGTLLGAVRHHGFIPWDDDIDLWMLRNDYDKFVKSFCTEDGLIFVESVDNSLEHIFPYAKIYYKNSKIIQFVHKERHNTYIGVDLFPLDYLPNDESERRNLYKKVRKRKLLYDIKSISYKRDRSSIKKVMLTIINHFIDGYSIHNIAKDISNYVKKNAKIKSNYVGSFLCPYGKKTCVRSEMFEKYIRVDFENQVISIPIGYDAILKSLYGDYLTLPPKEQRISTHSSQTYIKNI